MRRDHVHLDVFADCAFHGNQLAVFTASTGLNAERMQRIAGEMAFPETTFVFQTQMLNRVQAALRSEIAAFEQRGIGRRGMRSERRISRPSPSLRSAKTFRPRQFDSPANRA